jgi:hypothetical protein
MILPRRMRGGGAEEIDMADQFQNSADQVSAPATRAVAVTPHDSNPLTDIPKALFVGTGGNITMRGVNGTADQVWKNVPSGSLLPFRALYVRATGTSAADLLALY